MYDFRSRGLCSFGPCLASCFKKMRKWKTKEKKLKYNFNDGHQVEIFPMSGDLAIEVAMDIEYRISAGRISVLKNSYGLGRTSCTNRKEL